MSDVKKLLKKHGQLNQLDNVKVESHVQRHKDDWVINTIMLEGYDVPFKYRRKTVYKSLKGARVNPDKGAGYLFVFIFALINPFSSCLQARSQCPRLLFSSG
jgi:hypothetical protein